MKDFIPNLDDANTRIRQLETKHGLPHGEFIEFIEQANDRIEELERLTLPSPTTKTQAPTQTAAPAPIVATGIARAIAANSGVATKREPSGIPLFGLQRAIAANAAKTPR